MQHLQMLLEQDIDRVLKIIEAYGDDMDWSVHSSEVVQTKVQELASAFKILTELASSSSQRAEAVQDFKLKLNAYCEVIYEC